jgi:hypothetical protein
MSNNPPGEDCWEILAVLQRSLAAAQPKRSFFWCLLPVFFSAFFLLSFI